MVFYVFVGIYISFLWAELFRPLAHFTVCFLAVCESSYLLSTSFLCQRRQWHPTLVLLPGKSHGWRSLVGCSPWGREESDTTEQLHFHFSLSCIGEGNGNPLQCSCLENPRDRGAWSEAVYGVTQSRTQLKRLSSSSSFLCGKVFLFASEACLFYRLKCIAYLCMMVSFIMSFRQRCQYSIESLSPCYHSTVLSSGLAGYSLIICFHL